MRSAAIHDQPRPLTDRQRAALISLLADDDPVIYQTIRTTLLRYGLEVLEWLRPYALSPDVVLRRRTQEIVQFLSRQDADNQFLSFCQKHGEDLDIELGAWLLAMTQYPDINIAAYQALLDSYAGELRERLKGHLEADKILTCLTHYLFTELGYTGNEQNYYDPENSYFNRVMDRRIGNPICLCLLLLLVSRRLCLPIVGIGMPGHFLCRYQSSTMETFIDAFNRGRLLNKAECIKYLLQSGHGYLDGYLAPMSPRRMLLRMCANLHQIYVDLEMPKDAARLQRYIVALSK